MFDDLRNSADMQGSFTPDDEVDLYIEPLLKKKQKKSSSVGIKINSNKFLGMNAFQRFIISALLFGMVCMLGTMLLFLANKIALPF